MAPASRTKYLRFQFLMKEDICRLCFSINPFFSGGACMFTKESPSFFVYMIIIRILGPKPLCNFDLIMELHYPVQISIDYEYDVQSATS